MWIGCLAEETHLYLYPDPASEKSLWVAHKWPWQCLPLLLQRLCQGFVVVLCARFGLRWCLLENADTMGEKR